MKVNINFIYSFLILVLISVVTIEFHNNNVLESRINTITKYSKPLNSEKSFKEDYYITQQSHDTNLILVVFTVLIAFTGLFTYVNIIERYNSKMSEVKDEIEKYKSEYDVQHKRLVKLESDSYFQTAISYYGMAKKLKQENEISKYLVFSMCAMEKYAQVIKLTDDEIFKKRVQNTLNSIVDLDFSIVKDEKNYFEVTDLEFYVHKIRIATISEALDIQNLQMFNTIVSKIKII